MRDHPKSEKGGLDCGFPHHENSRVEISMKKAGHYVFLLFVIVFLTVLVRERILWILGISYPIFHDYDYDRGRALKAGKAGWYRSEGEAYIQINQDGFHDTEHSLEKPKGVYRIAVLGDSYAEAR